MQRSQVWVADAPWLSVQLAVSCSVEHGLPAAGAGPQADTERETVTTSAASAANESRARPLCGLRRVERAYFGLERISMFAP